MLPFRRFLIPVPLARALAPVLCASLIPVLALSAGCKTRPLEIGPGPDAAVTIVLVNPTTCSDCDPLSDVNTLRLDVVRSATGEHIATDSSPYPGEPPSLPDLTGFGVVRVELLGLSGNEVVSVGRTAPFAVAPGQRATIPMLFLPANRAIALTAELVEARSQHVAFRRIDGRIALIGGVEPAGVRRFDSVEVYDPATHTFAPDASGVPIPLFSAVNALDDGSLLLVGGEGSTGVRQSGVQVYEVSGEGLPGAMVLQSALPEPRSRGCVARVGPQKGVVMGGVDPVSGDSVVDVMRLGAEGWEFTRAAVDGLDNAAVSACIGLDDGRVFVLGDDASQTGFFTYGDTDGSLTFASVAGGDSGDSGDSGDGDQFVRSPTLYGLDGGLDDGLDDGRVWLTGGVREGRVRSETYEIRADRGSFVPSMPMDVARARPDVDAWLDPGTLAIGCGWADDALTEGAEGVEILALDSEERLTVDLDRARPGCTMSVLPDGALLVSGGFRATDGDQVGAVIVLPYL